MRRVLSTEWLRQFRPPRTVEVFDAGCKGLAAMTGPRGVVTFYRFETVGGKRHRVRLGHFGSVTLADARARVNEAKERKNPGASPTIRELAESYHEVLARRAKTADELYESLRLHVLDAVPFPNRGPFGSWPAREVEPQDCAAVIQLAATVRPRGKRTTGGPGAARRCLQQMRAVFMHGIRKGQVSPPGPVQSLNAADFGAGARSRRRRLSDEEVRALFDALRLNALLDGTAKRESTSPTVRLGIALLLYVPVRSHSLIGARWSEFTLDDGTWVVPTSRLKLNPRDRETAEPFEVPLPATAVAILRRLRAEAGASPWVLPSPLEPEQHVAEKALIDCLRRYQADGRLVLSSPATIHDERRTWRTLASQLGVDAVVAEKSLGHVSALRILGFSTSADVYERASRLDARREAAERVGAYLDKVRLGQERSHPGPEAAPPTAQDVHGEALGPEARY